jgi:hypothetical protein
MARLHIFAPFNPELLGALWLVSKKNPLFEAEIYVPGYAQKAGFLHPPLKPLSQMN